MGQPGTRPGRARGGALAQGRSGAPDRAALRGEAGGALGGGVAGPPGLCSAVGAASPPQGGRRRPGRTQKNFAELVSAVIPEPQRGKPVELWWQDEARVGQQGTLTRIWAKRGARPRGVRDQRYTWAYLFGAICPARGVGAAWVVPKANAWSMNLHLEEISRQVALGAHAVVVLDGAGWHQTGGRLNIPSNLSLLHLPPYSPELNPVENVWQYLRQNQLSNRVYDSYEAIVAACCKAWNDLMADPDRIRSIGSRDYAAVKLQCRWYYSRVSARRPKRGGAAIP